MDVKNTKINGKIDVKTGDVVEVIYEENTYFMLVIDVAGGYYLKSFDGFMHFGGAHSTLSDLNKALEAHVKHSGQDVIVYSSKSYEITLVKKEEY